MENCIDKAETLTTTTGFLQVGSGVPFPLPSSWKITPSNGTVVVTAPEPQPEAVNGMVAIKPFESLDPKVSVKNSFATIENRQNLVAADVIFPSGDFASGDRIYVRGEHAHAHGQKVYSVDGVAFCLIPAAQVVLAKKVPRPAKIDWGYHPSVQLLKNDGPPK